MRTIAYVDGFNLYYGCLKGTPYKWLDLVRLFRHTLPPQCQLVKVKYFTARVSSLPHDPGAPQRQDVYLRALKAHSGALIEIFEGRFSVKNVRMPRVANPAQFVDVIRTDEKGSDVNLAVELVNDAWEDSFDCAAIASNDADLARALKIAKQYRRKRILLYTPGAPVRRTVSHLKQWSNKRIICDAAALAACQLPNPIAGTALHKPANW